MFVNRPKASDDVEDLERQQEQFLTSHSQLSVTVKRAGSTEKRSSEDQAPRGAVKKQSRFKAEREQARDEQKQHANSSADDIVMQDIVERPGTAIYVPEAPVIGNGAAAFPTAAKRDIAVTAQNGKSIFMSCMLAEQIFHPQPTASSAVGLVDSEYEAIHKENLEKLKSMSIDEIMLAQAELLKKLDPGLVAFIKSGKVKPQSPARNTLRGGSQVDDAILQELCAPKTVAPSSPSTVEFVEDELPLRPSEMSKYPNMEMVEKDKLAWMTLLPKPRKSDDGKKFTCRFDLEGRILAPDADLPTHSALHHHGEEPERAGYTLDELAKFLTSAVQSQRILALQVFSNILVNHHSGKYDRCFPVGTGVIETLVENGFVILLRVALDDQGASQLSEALKTLHSLIVNPNDELCLDLICDWSDEEPYLRPAIKNLSEDKIENVSELSDAEVVSTDIVQGLLRMDLLPRIRYLLEVCQPDAGGVAAALGVLTRIARQCPESAQKIVECPRLCSFIMNAYLPPYGWNEPQIVQGKLATSEGLPLAQAMKFVRVLCQSSKTASVKLIAEHKLESLIAVFLNIDPEETKLPKKEILQLQLETLRLLRVLLRHGLGSELFDNLSPIIIRQLQFVEQISCQSLHGDQQLFDLQYASCLIQCVYARMRRIVLEQSNDWEAISHPVIKSAITASGRWLHNFAENKLRVTAYGALSVVLRFLADVHLHRRQVDLSSVVSSLLSIPQHKWTSVWRDMERHSVILVAPTKSGSQRDTEALTSLASIQFGEQSVIPIANESNPVFFLNSIIYFIWTYRMNGKNDLTELATKMLCDSDALNYLAALKGNDLTAGWFSRTETSLLYRMFRLCEAITNSSDLDFIWSDPNSDALLFRQCALNVLPLFSPDRALAVRSLLETVVYSKRFILDRGSPKKGVILHEVDDLEMTNAHGSLEDIASTELPSVKASVLDLVDFLVGSIPSKYSGTSASKSSQCEFLFRVGLLPKDWMYLPIRMLYAESLKQQPKRSPDEAKSEHGDENEVDDNGTLKKTSILDSLRNVSLLAWTSSIMSQLPPLVNFIRLSSVFLIDSDSFLDERIKELLKSLYSSLILPRAHNIEFENHSFKWDGLPAFSDFYALLVEQFGACSYGDAAFSWFLLTPLQMCYHKDFRKLVYIENESVLQAITIDENENAVQVEAFTKPRETDPDLLRAYRSALLSGTVKEDRNLLLYKILSRHVS